MSNIHTQTRPSVDSCYVVFKAGHIALYVTRFPEGYVCVTVEYAR